MTVRAVPEPAPTLASTQRIDKWLWHARVARTRTTASELVSGGKVRVNRERVVKPGAVVHVGDIVTVTFGSSVRAIKVKAFADRRGSATEAAQLFEELTVSPAVPKPQVKGDKATGRDRPAEATPGRRDPGAGRPTKRDRRVITRLMDGD